MLAAANTPLTPDSRQVFLKILKIAITEGGKQAGRQGRRESHGCLREGGREGVEGVEEGSWCLVLVLVVVVAGRPRSFTPTELENQFIITLFPALA